MNREEREALMLELGLRYEDRQLPPFIKTEVELIERRR